MRLIGKRKKKILFKVKQEEADKIHLLRSRNQFGKKRKNSMTIILRICYLLRDHYRKFHLPKLFLVPSPASFWSSLIFISLHLREWLLVNQIKIADNTLSGVESSGAGACITNT